MSAFGRAVLLVLGVALAVLGTTAHARATGHDASHERPRKAQATIEAYASHSGSDLREGEHTRLVSCGASSVLRARAASAMLAVATGAPRDTSGAREPRWCDVVQCRRVDGVQLLGFATPPPLRR